jgi:hypothetical protein
MLTMSPETGITSIIWRHLLGDPQNGTIRALELLVLGLLVWRFWRFTLSPKIYPNDPKELPYWIPCT